MNDSTRLERALEAWLAFQARGGAREELLQQHPDLADLLREFFAEPADQPADERLLGDFRILREVGRGGGGIVYEARQRSLNRRVALKVLARDAVDSPAAPARFRREALHLARCAHPGIVAIYDVGSDSGQHWIAMEFVAGGSLAQRLDALRPTGHRGDSLRTLVTAVAEVAEALETAHELGIVHRDVKPSNMLLRDDGSAVLTDFGIARDAVVPAMTQAGTLSGTPHYVAPERVLDGPADARTDVFALGVTLYECLVLRRPFEGATIEHVLHAIVASDPVDPRRLRPGLPRDLVAVTLKALEKEPSRRYQSAGELAGDLRAFLDLRPVTASPPTAAARAWRWMRRKPLQAALGATAALALLLFGLWLAHLPELRALERSRREAQYENEVAAALEARQGSDSAAAYLHCRAALQLLPERSEAVIAHCLCLARFDGSEAGLAELERRAGADSGRDELERLRALLLRWRGRNREVEALEARLPEPTAPLSLWLLSAVLSQYPDDPTSVGRARNYASLAVRMSKQPQLLPCIQLALVATMSDDRPLRRECAAALEAHWPQNGFALKGASMCLDDLDPPRSLALFHRAYVRGCDSPEEQRMLADKLLKAGRTAEALGLFRKALQRGLSDEHREIAILRICTLSDGHAETSECERWLREAPGNPIAIKVGGLCAAMRGDGARAHELLTRAADLLPGDVTLQCAAARAMVESGDLAGGLTRLGQAMARAPASTMVHDDLLEHTAARPELAVAERQRWAQVRDRDPAAWAKLAEALLASDLPMAIDRAVGAAATADYLARGLDPDVSELHAKTLERLGDPAGAARVRARSQAAACAAK